MIMTIKVNISGAAPGVLPAGGVEPRPSPATQVQYDASLGAPALFRMGEGHAPTGWRRWGWAITAAVLVHGIAVAGVAVMPPVEPPVVATPADREVVFYSFPAPPPAASGPRLAAVPERASRRAPKRVARQPVVPRVIEQLPETPVEAERVEVSTAAVAPDAATTMSDVPGGAVGGTVGGVSGGMLGGTGDALTLAQVSRAPTPLSRVVPEYPRRAKLEGITGTVIVRVIIGPNGELEEDSLEVIRSVRGLDAAALAALKQWRFSPGLGRQGQPVRVRIDVPFDFSIQ